jgi:Recombination endonuclease VII
MSHKDPAVRSAYLRDWKKRNPDKVRANAKVSRRRYVLRQYGMTIADYAALFESQTGKCKICEIKSATCIDHDHDTGRIRGLVCRSCNTKLGWFDRNRERILEYV